MTISCLICLGRVEKQLSVCISACGHVFHHSCIHRWVLQGAKSCPKCRCPAGPDSFIKLYFGSTNTDEGDSEIHDLLAENKKCRDKIDRLLSDIKDNLETIDRNTKEIEELVTKDTEPEMFPFEIRDVAVTLSRSEESKRIQDYLDRVNQN